MDERKIYKTLQESNQNLRLEQGPHYYSHLSDALRLFLMWQYGGTYMDTDVILYRRMDDVM